MNKVIRKYKEASLPVKAAMWFTLCSIVQKGISFISVPIFTRILTIGEFGTYNVYNSWLGLITIVSTLKLYSGCYFNGLYKYKDKKYEFTSSVQTLSTVLTLAAFGIIFCFREKVSAISGLSAALLALMLIKILITPPIEFWMTEQRVLYKYKKLVFMTICIALLNPLLGFIGVLSTDNYKVEMRVAGGLVVFLVFGVIFYCRNLIKGKTLFNREYWGFALRFDIPLLPHNLALSVLNQSDRIMINNMVGPEQAAIYSLAYAVAMTLQMVKDAIRDALLPWIYSRLKDKNYQEMKRVTNIVLILVSLISFLFIAFAPEVIMIMGSSEYREAVWIIPPVAISLYFMLLYNIFSSIEFYYEKTKYAMVASMASAGLNIVLNYIFIKLFGYMAAGYTTLFCYIFLSVAHYFMARSVLKKKNENMDMVDTRFIVFFSGFILILTFVFVLLYRNTLLRYVTIAGILLLLFIMRERVKGIFIMLRSSKKKTA